MNYKLRTNKGFTLIELVVAIGVLALMVSFSGAIFKMSIESHRVAGAHAEIMQKLRAITDQLNADFKGLRKDGEIFVVWVALPGEPNVNDPDRPVRFDRIMFFANGDFQTYDQDYGDIRGNVARISYMLAGEKETTPAFAQKREKRILARTQHILTADIDAPTLPNLGSAPEQELAEWHNSIDTEQNTLAQWKNMAWEPDKKIALSVIADADVDQSGLGGGAIIDPTNPDSIHMLLCEGVGEFKIQGWHDDLRRWVPEVDPYTDFDIALPYIPGLLYPYRRFDRGGEVEEIGEVVLGGEFAPDEPYYYPRELLDEEHFNEIPGLGRALKFTFTLYDSKGIIKNGRTFTHIVYLEN